MATDTEERLATAGELLIRAAAVLATVPPAERTLPGGVDAALDRALYDALIALAALSPMTKRSLRAHGRDAFASLLARAFV